MKRRRTRVEKSIRLSGETVRAILDGRQTQIRQPCKLTPDGHVKAAPYAAGDLLYVKETWATTEQAGYHPADVWCVYRATDPDWDTMEGWCWRSSIHMPKEFARLWLRVLEVHVNHLTSICRADVLAAGIAAESNAGKLSWPTYIDCELAFLRAMCQKHGWDAAAVESGELNPLVWVYSFERVRRKGR